MVRVFSNLGNMVFGKNFFPLFAGILFTYYCVYLFEVAQMKLCALIKLIGITEHNYHVTVLHHGTADMHLFFTGTINTPKAIYCFGRDKRFVGILDFTPFGGDS